MGGAVFPPSCLAWGLHQRLLDTHRQVKLSLFWGHWSFLLALGMHKVLFVPSKSLFPQSCGSSVIKSHWPPKSNLLGVLITLLDPQVGKSIVSPRTFLTENFFGIIVLQFLGHLLGSSGGANGDLLQMLCDPNLLQPEPLSLCQAIADPCLHRRHSNTQRQVWVSLYGDLWGWF